MNKFWMVYLSGYRAPTFRHASKESAQAEASRLVTEHGGTAFVLEAKTMLQKSGVIITELEEPIPPNTTELAF